MVEPMTPGTFIPHDTAAPMRASRGGSGGLSELLVLGSVVIFVASAALAVAVFLYAQFLQSEKTSKLQQLQSAQAAFEPNLIQQLTRLDDRMHAASAVLGAHLAPTVFFDTLAQSTLQTITFRTLSLDASDPMHMTIKMQGIARSVNSIALQADLFSKNGVITSPIFTGINRQIDGVHFDLSASVNPSAIKYTALGQPSQTQEQQTNTPASAASSSSPFEGDAVAPAR